MAFRVPTVNVSVVDLTCRLKKVLFFVWNVSFFVGIYLIWIRELPMMKSSKRLKKPVNPNWKEFWLTLKMMLYLLILSQTLIPAFLMLRYDLKSFYYYYEPCFMQTQTWNLSFFLFLSMNQNNLFAWNMNFLQKAGISLSDKFVKLVSWVSFYSHMNL